MKMIKKNPYTSYEELLQERLKNPELIESYLDDALRYEDTNVFKMAIKDVYKANNNKIPPEIRHIVTRALMEKIFN